MSDTAYLFIDGGYLRMVQDDAMQSLFGVPGEIDFGRVRTHCGKATHKPILRVFYYDSIDDVPRNGESDSDYQSRVEQQVTFLRSIQRLDGFFVRLGSVTGRRPGKIRQKEVDVLLAVDMLEHSFRKNMDIACLLAGDRDFAPVVDSVVRLGTRVQVFYDPRSATHQLYDAADTAIPLTIDDLWGWGTSRFCSAHPIPTERRYVGQANLAPRTVLRTGTIGNTTVHLWSQHVGLFTIAMFADGTTTQADSQDQAPLEKWVEMKYGAVNWAAATTA